MLNMTRLRIMTPSEEKRRSLRCTNCAFANLTATSRPSPCFVHKCISAGSKPKHCSETSCSRPGCSTYNTTRLGKLLAPGAGLSAGPTSSRSRRQSLRPPVADLLASSGLLGLLLRQFFLASTSALDLRPVWLWRIPDEDRPKLTCWQDARNRYSTRTTGAVASLNSY